MLPTVPATADVDRDPRHPPGRSSSLGDLHRRTGTRSCGSVHRNKELDRAAEPAPGWSRLRYRQAIDWLIGWTPTPLHMRCSRLDDRPRQRRRSSDRRIIIVVDRTRQPIREQARRVPGSWACHVHHRPRPLAADRPPVVVGRVSNGDVGGGGHWRDQHRPNSCRQVNGDRRQRVDRGEHASSLTPGDRLCWATSHGDNCGIDAGSAVSVRVCRGFSVP